MVTVDWPHHTLYLEKNAERTKPEVFNRSGILADFDERGKGLKVVIVLPAVRATKRVYEWATAFLRSTISRPSQSGEATNPLFSRSPASKSRLVSSALGWCCYSEFA